ncbi:MAG: gamma-glutamylputrescine oxidase [Flavobacteriales bacterium]|jgi:gamma-glutamylputrescine oxidase
MNLSYWERQQWFGDFDVVIIGSGIVGLSAALQLKRREGSLKIAVLERGFLPTGASTKNAGFACFGSPSEILDDLKSHSEKEIIETITKRYQGLQLLLDEVGESKLGYLQWGSNELFTAAQNELFEKCESQLTYLNGLVQEATGLKEAMFLNSNSIKSFDFSGFDQAIGHQFEGQIDSGKMMQQLLSKVEALGVSVFNGFKVAQLHSDTPFCEIVEKSGVTIRSKQVIVATNGFAQQLMPELVVKPARAQVLITKPIRNLKVKGTFHMDEGYYYFRNVGDRILFGGGRNLDFEGETTTEMELSAIIQHQLKGLLQEKIVPNHLVEIDYSWSGIMGVGNQKKAIVSEVQPRVFCAVRLGGMGIAIGSQIGKEVADLCLGINE